MLTLFPVDTSLALLSCLSLLPLITMAASKLDRHGTLLRRLKDEGLSYEQIITRLAEEYRMKVAKSTLSRWFDRQDTHTESPTEAEAKATRPPPRRPNPEPSPNTPRNGPNPAAGNGYARASQAELWEAPDGTNDPPPPPPPASDPAYHDDIYYPELAYQHAPEIPTDAHAGWYRRVVRIACALLVGYLGLYWLLHNTPSWSYLQTAWGHGVALYTFLSSTQAGILIAAIIVSGLALNLGYRAFVLAFLVGCIQWSVTNGWFFAFASLLILTARVSLEFFRHFVHR